MSELAETLFLFASFEKCKQKNWKAQIKDCIFSCIILKNIDKSLKSPEFIEFKNVNTKGNLGQNGHPASEEIKKENGCTLVAHWWGLYSTRKIENDAGPNNR